MTQREARHQIWLLHCVPAMRFGRLLCAATILALLLGFYWAVGIFETPADPDATPSAALFFSAILAYIVPVFHFITERTLRAFDDLAPHLDAEPGKLDAWRRSITEKSRRWILLNLSLGTAAWVVHSSVLYGSFGEMFARISASMAHFAIVLGTALVWTAMTLVIFALVDNARLFNRLARRIPIDLLDPGYLTAFARVAVNSTLALIGALASFPLMWIDSPANPLASAPGMIAITSAMVFLFLLPIWPVRRAITDAKQAELARIRSGLEEARDWPGDALLEDAEALARINQLLAYRREIEQVHEWPFDLGVVTRLGLYLVIPPLSWICAALIEKLVDVLL